MEHEEALTSPAGYENIVCEIVIEDKYLIIISNEFDRNFRISFHRFGDNSIKSYSKGEYLHEDTIDYDDFFELISRAAKNYKDFEASKRE